MVCDARNKMVKGYTEPELIYLFRGGILVRLAYGIGENCQGFRVQKNKRVVFIYSLSF